MDIESQRRELIANKAKLLADLKLDSSLVKPSRRDPTLQQSTKKRKLSFESRPSRTSARIASTDRPSYNEEGEKYNYIEPKPRTQPKSKPQPKAVIVENDLRSLIPTQDAESIRAKWSKWTPTASAPTRDDNGTFHFSDSPLFTPNKSPEEMLREGCFGGSYFRPLKSRKLGILIEEDYLELPPSWHSGLDISRFLTSPVYNPDVNKYKQSCGQSIEEWEAAGWIAYEHDIRGWFQWYCRFYQGRRCDDDDRQISRWRKCVGDTGRWRRMLLKKYLQMGVRDVFDDGEEEDREVSPVMHQTCHHWAYEVKQEDLDRAWEGR